jgi:hypothetical protein
MKEPVNLKMYKKASQSNDRKDDWKKEQNLRDYNTRSNIFVTEI